MFSKSLVVTVAALVVSGLLTGGIEASARTSTLAASYGVHHASASSTDAVGSKKVKKSARHRRIAGTHSSKKALKSHKALSAHKTGVKSHKALASHKAGVKSHKALASTKKSHKTLARHGKHSSIRTAKAHRSSVKSNAAANTSSSMFNSSASAAPFATPVAPVAPVAPMSQPPMASSTVIDPLAPSR